jgi:beta-lactamase regulating signal transducer with metallopeptidase domain
MMTMQTVMDGWMGMSEGALTAFAGSMLLRGAALLALAAVATYLMRRRAPAALRHHVWMLAMTGLLALPLLTHILPDWRVAMPDRIAEMLPSVTSTGIGLDAGAERAAARPGAVPAPVRSANDPGAATTRSPGDLVMTKRPSEEAAADPVPSERGVALPWTTLLLAIWGVGCLALLARLGLGLGRAARLVRRAHPVGDRQWNVLVSLLSLKSGLARGVRVVSSSEVNVPMAWGIFNLWLVLPKDFESWPAERRRVVVLHELAHLRRRDCLAQAVARLALALHWPNPLAWLAARRLTAEREQACDDAVLTAGVGGPSYAHHLVEIARGLSRPSRPARAAVAMARPSELENRVLAILDERRSQRTLGRRTARLAVALLAALLLPVATVQPSAVGAAVDSAEPRPDLTTEGGVDTASIAAVETDAGAGMDATADADGAERTEDDAGTDGTGNADGEISADGKLSWATLGLDAAPAAGDTIEERVFRALEKAIASDDPEVRAQVAHTLGSIESPRGVDLLTGVVQRDENPEVRETAAWALGMIESASAVPALATATGDPVEAVREQAAWALGMIESVDGVEPLLALLDDESSDVRDQAAWGLGMIESSSAVSGLTTAFTSESSAAVRAQIIWALGMIEDRESADTIVDALEDPDPGVRKQALWALGQVLN